MCDDGVPRIVTTDDSDDAADPADEDVLAAFEDYPDGASTGEIADAVGCSPATAHRRLHELLYDGRVAAREVGPVLLWYADGPGDDPPESSSTLLGATLFRR